MTASHRTLVSALAWLGAGCAGCSLIPSVGPSYKQPAVIMPQGWSTTAADLKAEPSTGALKEWWRTLGDEKLNQLITVGIENNNNLAIAHSRVREARAQLGIQTAPLLPSLGAAGDLSRTAHGTNSNLTSTAPSSERAATSGSTNLYSAGLDARWEIEYIWGAS